MGPAVWCADEPGPFQTVPQPGDHWAPTGKPVRQPHEYQREGTMKILTLFNPATGQVRIQPARQSAYFGKNEQSDRTNLNRAYGSI